MASAYIAGDPTVRRGAFPTPYLGHLEHFATTSAMSYSAPCDPVGRARRLVADGLHGEFPSRSGVASMRSIGGHEAFPVPVHPFSSPGA